MEIALPVQPAVKSNSLNHGPLFARRIATIQDAVIRLNSTAMLSNLRNVGRVVVLISINSNNFPDFPSGAHFFLLRNSTSPTCAIFSIYPFCADDRYIVGCPGSQRDFAFAVRLMGLGEIINRCRHPTDHHLITNLNGLLAVFIDEFHASISSV
jgi:hypothetical protein